VTAFWHTSKVKTLADALAHEATLGATGVGSTVYIYPNVLNRVLGTKFKIVSGYEGTTQSALAMERGEVEGMSTGWFTVKTTKKDWLDNRKVNIIVQFVAERHPDLPNVPTMVDMARTSEERQLFRLFSNEGDIGKAIMAPPDLPPATLTTLRRAFDAMARDPEFIADADRLQVERESMPGENLQKMVEAVAQTPPAIIEHAKALLK
jgi:tripartite-type tricarboxylate transporter receptor subunit TctC